MNSDHDTSDNSDCGPRVKTRFHFESMRENREPAEDGEQDDNNQEGSELYLADDDGGDFNELAAETSSLVSSDCSGFVCGEHGTITAVRVRPMLPSEKKSGYRAIVDMNVINDYLVTRITNPIGLPPPQKHASARYMSNEQPLMVSASATDATDFPTQFTQEFKSDYNYWSFDHSSARQLATQQMVYEGLGVLALETVLQGQNCSVFACGQPGAGKTYTMMGNTMECTSSVSVNNSSNGVEFSTLLPERTGLIPRICQGLFAEIGEGKSQDNLSTLIMSYVEIYDERVYDLLSHTFIKKSLKVREHPEQGAFVERAQRVRVTSYSQVLELLEEGNRTRCIGSSHGTCRRSHTVLILSLTRNTLTDPVSMSSARSFETSVKSKLCLVDLASSERKDHSGASRLSLREASSIKRSLATLADVVGALAKRRSDGTQHQKTFVPYRNSVLTRLLKNCLGGRAKTIMLGAISPCSAHYEESIATLRYIERAKSVYGTIRAHVDANGDTIQRFLNEASELQSNLRDSISSDVPASIGNTCCGVPEFHEGCSDCESRDLKPSGNNAAVQNSQVVRKLEMASLRRVGDKVKVESTDCIQQEKAGEVLRRSVAILKLVAVRRHYQTLRKYRALGRWRKCAGWHAQEVWPHQDKLGHNDSMAISPLRSRKAGFPPLHTPASATETKAGDRVQDVAAAVVATDAICCSVVQEFLFPHSNDLPKVLTERQATASKCLLEILASSSEYDRSEFRLNCGDNEQQLDTIAAENWCDLEDDEFNQPDPLTFSEELPNLKSCENSPLSPGTRYEENTIHSSLSLCVDSLDLARRTLGPGERNLRLRTKDDKRVPSGSTGVERELLRHLDKRFVAMTRRLEDLIALQSHSEARKLSQSCCKILETMIGEFCLQIIGRLCNQLPSASSACVAGRLQLETQLEQFSERLKRLLPKLALGSIGIDVENDTNAVFSLATDLLVMTERIKLVWNFAEQKKRERLLHEQAFEATTIKDGKIAAKIAALEEQNAELFAKCEALAKTNQQCEELEVDYDEIAASKSMDNLGSKLAVEIARTRDVQARNDELLCRFETLNRALAAASARVSALEAENSRLSSEPQDSVANSSQSVSATLEALQNRVISLQTDLESANTHSLDLEGELKGLKSTHLEEISELQSVNALFICEKKARKSVKADLASLKVQDEVKIEGMRQQLDDAEARIKELEEAINEERQQTLNAALLASEAKNAELSASLAQAKTELLDALEKTHQAENERDEQIILLVETEEALTSACDREKDLTNQLHTSSARELDGMNRVRRELHEATLEIASLREELTELLDHSTLQSATIETLELEQTDSMRRAEELEQERDELLSRYQCEQELADLQIQQSAKRLRRLERHLETERQGSMNMHETLQKQTDAFMELHSRQLVIDVEHCEIAQELEVQSRKLHECQMDLHASVRGWVRAEAQSGVLRIYIDRLNRNLTEMKEACLMQVADTESARLIGVSCRGFPEVTSEPEQAVTDHLSSVDAWFEEVISGSQETPSSAPISTLDEDYVSRSSLLNTLTDLSALTTELLIVYEASPQKNDQRNILPADGLNKGAPRLMELHEVSFEAKEAAMRLTSSKESSEVIQLRKLVVKLKEALDAKDDMLLFLDGKVRRLELSSPT